MSYTNDTLTDLADLFSKLGTFLGGTPGWTISTASGVFAARKTGSGYDIGFAAQWNTGTPSNVGIYQWYNAAYNTGVRPDQQTNDSGTRVRQYQANKHLPNVEHHANSSKEH